MPAAHRLQQGADGRLLVVKEAEGGPAADRLRREAVVLVAARHPGVVELEERVGETGVATAYVGARTLASAAGDDDRVLAALASVAATMADLHERGIAHGRLTADHVLVNTDGRAVVCGWADARLADDPGAGAEAADDVAALGALAAGLNSERPGPPATALRRAAAMAADDPAPSMRALATLLRAAHPGPTDPPLTIAPRPRPRPRRPRRSGPRPGLTLGVGLAALVVAAGVIVAVAATRAPSSPPPPPAPPTTTTTTTHPPSSTTTTVSQPSPAIDVAGPVVTRDGVRFRVASADDAVAVGDWDCDGSPTPAVLRPATGEVWRYQRWAETGEEVAATPAGVAPGAVSVRAAPTDDGCHRLALADAGGRPVRVGGAAPPRSPAAAPSG